ncbi:MAG: hypothetical protein IJ087_07390 [Eggerthellaceae bacterium]|nr:hypothetical protein [Eggerthellaceae bacterium]
MSVEQVARDFFVNTGTVNSWIKKGSIAPTATFPFGSKQVHLFSPEDVAAIRERLAIPVHDDGTIRDDFFTFLEERDCSLSYEMPFPLSFIADRLATAAVAIGHLLRYPVCARIGSNMQMAFLLSAGRYSWWVVAANVIS